ncbi:MAG: amidohydrolase family protein [Myxococcota bacterium]
MIIDSHAHLEPRMLDVARMEEKLRVAGVDRVMLIPALNDPLPETPERLLAVIRHLMARRSTRPLAELVHRATMTGGGDLRLAGTVYRIYAQPDNEPVAALVAERPDLFSGWIFLNPRTPGVLDELERYRAVDGMVGIKLHPHWHDYRTELLDPVLRRAEELRMPVLIHLGFRGRGDFRAMADRYPKLSIISAHAGFPFYRDLWRYKNEYPNLHVDLSSPYINEALARRAVAAMGPDRCLFGTDAPYGFHSEDGSYDYGEIRRWIERLTIRAEDRERIFSKNIQAILDHSRG